MEGVLFFPKWQFDKNNKVIDELGKVCRVLEKNHVSVLGQMLWLTKTNQGLGYETPIAALTAGNVQSVLEVASAVQLGQ